MSEELIIKQIARAIKDAWPDRYHHEEEIRKLKNRRPALGKYVELLYLHHHLLYNKAPIPQQRLLSGKFLGDFVTDKDALEHVNHLSILHPGDYLFIMERAWISTRDGKQRDPVLDN